MAIEIVEILRISRGKDINMMEYFALRLRVEAANAKAL